MRFLAVLSLLAIAAAASPSPHQGLATAVQDMRRDASIQVAKLASMHKAFVAQQDGATTTTTAAATTTTTGAAGSTGPTPVPATGSGAGFADNQPVPSGCEEQFSLALGTRLIKDGCLEMVLDMFTITFEGNPTNATATARGTAVCKDTCISDLTAIVANYSTCEGEQTKELDYSINLLRVGCGTNFLGKNCYQSVQTLSYTGQCDGLANASKCKAPCVNRKGQCEPDTSKAALDEICLDTCINDYMKLQQRFGYESGMSSPLDFMCIENEGAWCQTVFADLGLTSDTSYEDIANNFCPNATGRSCLQKFGTNLYLEVVNYGVRTFFECVDMTTDGNFTACLVAYHTTLIDADSIAEAYSFLCATNNNSATGQSCGDVLYDMYSNTEFYNCITGLEANASSCNAGCDAIVVREFNKARCCTPYVASWKGKPKRPDSMIPERNLTKVNTSTLSFNNIVADPETFSEFASCRNFQAAKSTYLTYCEEGVTSRQVTNAAVTITAEMDLCFERLSSRRLGRLRVTLRKDISASLNLPADSITEVAITQSTRVVKTRDSKTKTRDTKGSLLTFKVKGSSAAKTTEAQTAWTMKRSNGQLSMQATNAVVGFKECPGCLADGMTAVFPRALEAKAALGLPVPTRAGQATPRSNATTTTTSAPKKVSVSGAAAQAVAVAVAVALALLA
jgi:hypothetical protein